MSSAPTVFVGTNKFVECGVIISLQGTPLFSFPAVQPELVLEVSMQAPAIGKRLKGSSAKSRGTPKDLAFRTGGTRVEALWKKTRLLSAELLDDGIHVELDLRPIGLAVWTDRGALHIGGSELVNNVIERSGTGIAIG